MRPDQLGDFQSISDPRLHPDGVRIAFVVTRIDLETDRYDRAIWLWDGMGARQFTHGPGDFGPRWSPDGSRLAFLRASGVEGDAPQVAVMPTAGGEAVILTAFPLGGLQVEWSPDGGLLAVVGVDWTEEWAGLDAEERARRPRRIAHRDYRMDEVGRLDDRRANIYLVDPIGAAEPRRVTDGERDAQIAWRADGTGVGFLTARHDDRHRDFANQVWEVSIEHAVEAPIGPIGMFFEVSYQPDGTAHAVGTADRWDWPANLGLYRLRDGEATPIAAGIDRDVMSQGPVTHGPRWLSDGSALAIIQDRGMLRVVRIDGDAVEDVIGGERLVTAVTPRPDGSAFAFVVTTPTNPGELWWWADGVETRLTDLNGAFAADGTAPVHFTVTHDGVELDAWAYLPAGDGPVPLLLNIHGGPAAQYGWGFFDEFQVYASAGFGVIACNPRGSSGRGRDFVRAPVGRLGEERPPDLGDVLAVVGAALEQFERLDADRMGIMGGSYGGFMTAMILARDQRWKSAVPERGLYDFGSFAGTSDIGAGFPRMYVGDWSHEDWSPLWRAGPLGRAHRITTPCLIVHSEEDWRCPISQGEQLFSVLCANDVAAEMLRFPGGSHELSRSGRPTHRTARFEAILEWHGRHLAADAET